MGAPRYFFQIRDKAAQKSALEEAYRAGLVSEDEYMLCAKDPDDASEGDVGKVLEIMARIGVLGKVYYD